MKTEWLALPGWKTPPRPLDDWAEQLAALGHPARVDRESASVSWLEVGSLRMRGYAMMEGPDVAAINFEISAPDPAPAIAVLEAAALALGWEVHPDEGDDEDEDDD